ncbi:hypothetical protein [Ktedonospora formicarum]|uniref:Uncharacterized protein n=1 Tax=Ktedonospora formicarum TaxID=2778364 RepID=A0A8J3MWI1_9CHLR|nr:hypothetical protein [Ktedonospora formicarum]GHO47615.1 hypothetical protein KSX_57780 [Ktedonospora formicarum]
MAIIVQRKKVREVPLNATARLALHHYLEALPPEEQYHFPSKKRTAPSQSEHWGT